MVRKLYIFLLLLVFVMSVVGCATIMNGRNQTLPVTTNPSGAIVILDGVKQRTPATLILDRKQPSYTIRIEKEGYEAVDITLRRGVNGWIWGNILFGGIIGVIVDCATGSVNKFTPTEVEVNLTTQKLGLNDIKQISDKDILIVKLKE